MTIDQNIVLGFDIEIRVPFHYEWLYFTYVFHINLLSDYLKKKFFKLVF